MNNESETKKYCKNEKCGVLLDTTNSVISKRKDDKIYYRGKCKKCHSNEVSLNRGHTPRVTRTRCDNKECGVLLTDDTKTFKNVIKLDGTRSFQSRCKKCYFEYSTEYKVNNWNSKTKICKCCEQEKKYPSFYSVKDVNCKVCVKNGLKPPVVNVYVEPKSDTKKKAKVVKKVETIIVEEIIKPSITKPTEPIEVIVVKKDDDKDLRDDLIAEFLKNNKIENKIEPMKRDVPTAYTGKLSTTKTFVGVSHKSIISFE